MCEIFPEVSNCCIILSLRMGMLFISVFSMITGSITLAVVEQKTNTSYAAVKNLTEIRNETQAISNLSGFINSAISTMAVFFMFAGITLLFATLTDQEGFAQVFVWVIFLAIIIGLLLVVAIAFECLFQKACILSGLDWLSAAAALVASVFYLILWFYFITVANSYVLNG